MLDRLTGTLLLIVSVLVAAAEWGAPDGFYLAGGLGVVVFLALAAGRVAPARWPFLAVSLALFAWAAATRGDWPGLVTDALRSAGFIAGFFVALAWLRHAAGDSPAIARCGRYLAAQPPGRRYAALTAGGHLFALALNYGAIALLGSLAEASAERETNREIREIRTRRMLLAIQRGFVSTLPWSPLAFAVAISTAIVPGASWTASLGWCAVSALLIIALGWLIDTAIKPRLSGPRPPPTKPEGTWRTLLPLLLLLVTIVLSVGLLQQATHLRAVAVVMAVVPLLSLGWIAIQGAGTPEGRTRHLARRVARFAATDLPGYRSELVLLTTAGFIGTLGGALAAPWIVASGLDLTAIPAWALMLAVMWIIPLAGQLGMNPILAVSLMAPLLPTADQLGLAPSAIIVAITAGWSLCGITSPYTATTLLVGGFGHVSARHVGVVWNGPYVLALGAALSAWTVIVALI